MVENVHQKDLTSSKNRVKTIQRVPATPAPPRRHHLWQLTELYIEPEKSIPVEHLGNNPGRAIWWLAHPYPRCKPVVISYSRAYGVVCECDPIRQLSFKDAIGERPSLTTMFAVSQRLGLE
ncbi:hypothetical protein BS47DRAFT_1396804 [Hydnum rufescens UP504]|uniref:Uncharacterized protein n=1 Tax=Hydnum rufescens UP504 TaxID=1448309 RepID=A0A9P6APE6_9AGAM|nr:hypothetical protein BS47DRAFT_1396804 [Hydnum rufescens UP504]